MFKIYFKQAIQMLKQNLFISIISILGTALAIMMIMTLIVTDEIKNISVAPEINRDRTLHITYQVKRDTASRNWQSGSITYDIAKDYLLQLKTPEYVSVMSKYNPTLLSTVNKESSTDYMQAVIRSTDASFFKIFSFDFKEGEVFSDEEFKSGIPVAVLSESTAKNIFKSENAIGKTVQINFLNYRVRGIVKDVSPVFKDAGGDIWIPYTSYKGYENGGYSIALLAKSKADFADIINEVRNCEKKFGINNTPWSLYLRGPENQRINTIGIRANNEEEFEEAITTQNRKMIFIFLILLLIPALNLSGFSLSRIKKRTAEIGIRKAFGAKKHIILIQVLYENMITSLIGGAIGLILSYVIIFWLNGWLLNVPAGTAIPISTMVSTSVFIAVFVICVLLNLLSAGVSAYRASRMSIVDSLNQNDK